MSAPFGFGGSNGSGRVNDVRGTVQADGPRARDMQL
jgi:hypothetical protein